MLRRAPSAPILEAKEHDMSDTPQTAPQASKSEKDPLGDLPFTPIPLPVNGRTGPRPAGY